MVTVIRRFICGLHGHDALLHFERSRVSLQCTSCGYETPGWDLANDPSRRTAEREFTTVFRLPLLPRRVN